MKTCPFAPEFPLRCALSDSDGVAYPCGSGFDPQPTGAANRNDYDYKTEALDVGVVGSHADNKTLQTFWFFWWHNFSVAVCFCFFE